MREKFLSFLGLLLVIFAASAMELEIAKGGNGGKLFGAVTGKEISTALKAQHNMEIDSKKLVLADPIKAFGGYDIKAKLGYEVTGTFKVMVVEN